MVERRVAGFRSIGRWAGWLQDPQSRKGGFLPFVAKLLPKLGKPERKGRTWSGRGHYGGPRPPPLA